MTGESLLPVADAIADLLVEAGVRRAYTVPGESFLPLLESFDRHPELQVISTRHEAGAAFMAEADGKLTGTPAVVMGTRGVGASNLAIGLHTARQDSTPMLALIGQVETAHLGNEAFQEVDLPAYLREVSVWGQTVHRSDRAAETVARGLARATSARPGPAVIAMPADVLDGECYPQSPIVDRRPSAAREDEVLAISARLAAASRPVIIAGHGVNPGALAQLAAVYGAGVYAAFRRQDCFPNDDEHYLGHLTLGTPDVILEALQRADLILVLGERLDETTTQTYSVPRKDVPVVHVHPDPDALGAHQRADLALAVDPAVLTRQLLDVAAEADVRGEHGWWRKAHGAFLTLAEESAAPQGDLLHPGRAIDAVQRAAPAGTVVTNDAGNFSVYLHRQWRFNEPATQAAPISGAMGYAVPGAIGAALARPDRTVLGVAGDGGFLMTAVEIETAVRIGVPIKLLVLQNGLYGTIAMHQARAGNPLSAVDIGPVDIAQMSRALGAHAISVDDESALEDAARELFAHDGPAVMIVGTATDVILPGRLLSEMGRPA